MLLTPRNVDIKLSGILKTFSEENNLWFGYVKIENANIPRSIRRNPVYEGFLVSLYTGADIDENPNFSEYLAIRHQVLLGFNIPARDETNETTREKLWDHVEKLQDLLNSKGFHCNIGPEDIPATDIRILLFTSYYRGTPVSLGGF